MKTATLIFLASLGLALAKDRPKADPAIPADAAQAAFWKADSLMRALDLYYLQERQKREAARSAAQELMEKGCAEHAQTLDLSALQQGEVKCAAKTEVAKP